MMNLSQSESSSWPSHVLRAGTHHPLGEGWGGGFGRCTGQMPDAVSHSTHFLRPTSYNLITAYHALRTTYYVPPPLRRRLVHTVLVCCS